MHTERIITNMPTATPHCAISTAGLEILFSPFWVTKRRRATKNSKLIRSCLNFHPRRYSKRAAEENISEKIGKK
jgi:hypothetical protein